MNYLRLSLAAGILTLVLALPAFAGEMGTPIAPPPPPTGEMSCPSISDPVTEIALSLVQSMLSMF